MTWHLPRLSYLWMLLLPGLLCGLARSESPPECQTLSGLNLVLVADATLSVGKSHFIMLKNVLKSIIQDVGVSEERTHVGVITFSTEATIWNNFDDAKASNMAALLDMIDNIPNTLGSRTFIDRALVAAGNLLSAKRDHRDGVPDVCLLFTDGRTNTLSQPYEEIVPGLKKKGITIFAVGIGNDVDEQELHKIAGNNVLQVESFEQLPSKLREIEKLVCDPPSGCERLPGLDLALVADATQSVGQRHFRMMKDFLKSIIQDVVVSEERTHIGVITFHLEATIWNNFGDAEASNKPALLDMIDNIPHTLGNRTFIDRVLVAAEEKLFSAVGGHRDGVPRVLLLFTDGRTNKLSQPYEEIVPRLKIKGIQIVVVGIGRKVFQGELERIAGDNVLLVESFEQLAGKLREIEEMACTIDGGWTEWSCWSDCSKSCGCGTKSRTRSCTNPPPEGNGKECPGKKKQTKYCNDFVCPHPHPDVDGGYSDWSEWSECSKPCGGGERDRKRTCTRPPPRGEGEDCSRLGRDFMSEPCNMFACPKKPGCRKKGGKGGKGKGRGGGRGRGRGRGSGSDSGSGSDGDCTGSGSDGEHSGSDSEGRKKKKKKKGKRPRTLEEFVRSLRLGPEAKEAQVSTLRQDTTFAR